MTACTIFYSQIRSVQHVFKALYFPAAAVEPAQFAPSPESKLLWPRVIQFVISLAVYRRLSQCFGDVHSMPAPPELRDIVKLELLEKEPEQRIEEIWLDQYRFDPRYISRALNRNQHQTISKRFEESPMFVWPIKHEESGKYFVLLSQYQHKHIFFTSIDSYNNNPENAPTYFSMTFYDDLITQQRDIALVRGEVIEAIRLRIETARELMDDLLERYQDDTKYKDHIQKFNINPQGFDIEAYLDTFDFVKEANVNAANAV